MVPRIGTTESWDHKTDQPYNCERGYLDALVSQGSADKGIWFKFFFSILK